MKIQTECDVCGDDIEIILRDAEIKEEFINKFGKGEELRRAICDIIGVGYFQLSKIDIAKRLIEKFDK